MNKQIEEQFSAILDGEASELELRRVLQQLEEMDASDRSELLARWDRYQIVSSALGADSESKNIHFADNDFLRGVSEAVAEEDIAAVTPDHDLKSLDVTSNMSDMAEADVSSADDQKGKTLVATPAWSRFAVAASVTLAVIVGFQQYQLAGQASAVQVAGVEVSTEKTAGQFVEQIVAPSSADISGSQIASAKISESSPVDAAEAQSRLNDYLLQHANHAAKQNGQGIAPFARVANFEDE